jgi:hypothetical protein
MVGLPYSLAAASSQRNIGQRQSRDRADAAISNGVT